MFLSTSFSRGARLAALALVWCGGSLTGGAQTAFDAFDANLDGNVYAVVAQPDGRILVGGSFTALVPNRFGPLLTHQRIARLLPNGSSDESFQFHCDGDVTAIALQADGRILIGGKFSRVWVSGESVPTAANRVGLARLNVDGTLDATFDPHPAIAADRDNQDYPISLVRAIAVQADGKIVVGGAFTGFKSGTTFVTHERLARLNSDGSLDPTFTTEVDNVVQAIAVQPDGAVLVGGGFSKYRNDPTVQWNSPTVSNARGLMRLLGTGAIDPSFTARANNRVLALRVMINGQILVGGEFTKIVVGTVETTRTFLARLNVNGAVDTTFDPAPNAAVESLAVQADGKVLLGGRFTTINPGGLGAFNSGHVARVFSNGDLDRNFVVNANGSVFAMAVQSDGAVILGGNFGSASSQSSGQVQRSRLARVQPDGNVETLFAPPNGRARHVIRDTTDNSFIVVGDFLSFGGVTRTNIARFTATGGLVMSFNPRVNGAVTAVAIDASRNIIIGGSFSAILQPKEGGGEDVIVRAGLARLKPDGTVDMAFDPRANGRVHAILVQPDGKLIIGGAFNSFQPGGTGASVGRVFLARLLADGKVDETFECNTDGQVLAITKATDTSFYVGGEFNNLVPKGSRTSEFRRYLGRVSGDGVVDDKFDPRPNAPVETLVVQPDGKLLVGGQFNSFFPAGASESVTRMGLARISAEGVLDTTFDPRTDGPVYAIAPLSDNLIVVGGAFGNLKPNDGDVVTRRSIAFLDGAGKVLADRDIQANDFVWSMLPVGADRVLVAGQFSSLFRADGTFVTVNQQLTMLRADGSVDPAFVVSAGAGATGVVNAIVQQPDGPVLVGGSFDDVGGSYEPNLMRLTYAGVASAGFGSRINGPVNSIFLRGPTLNTINTTGPAAWFTAAGTLRPLSEFTTQATALLNGTVEAVLRLSDGSILLGGTFTNTAGTTGGNLVKIKPDGTLDETFNPSPTGTVTSLALDGNGRLLIGGSFTRILSTDRKNFARLTTAGTLDTLDLRLNNPVRTIVPAAATGTAFYVGGDFSTASIGTADAIVRTGLVLITATDVIDPTFAPALVGPNGASVFAILPQTGGTHLLIGGTFVTAGGVSHSQIARISASTGAPDATFTLQYNDLVESIVEDNGGYLVGGYFTQSAEVAEATGSNTFFLSRFEIDSAGKATIDEDYAPNLNGPVHQVARDTLGRIMIGGGFTSVSNLNGEGTTVRRFVARFNANGTLDDSFNPQPNGTVWAFSLQPTDNSVIMVGEFTNVLPEASIMVGGGFTSVGSVAQPYLALLNADGSAAIAPMAAPDGAVNAIAGFADGRILLGGAFSNVDTTPRAGLAMLNSDGTLDTTFVADTDGEVSALTVQADGRVIIGGTFATAGGAAHANLARVATDGTFDGTFNPSTNGAVATVVAQPDGRILVAGSFTTINGAAQPYLARLLATGALDPSFAPVLNGSVAAVVLQSDGGVLIGGTFTSVSGSSRLRFARLNAAGAVDANVRFDLDPGVPGVSATSEVRAISVLPDGRAMVGGSFQNAGGRSRYLVTRAPASGVAAQTATVNASRTVVTWVNGGSRAEFAAVNFGLSTDGETFTELGAATRTGAPGTWQLTVPALPANQLYYIRARATLPSSRNYSTGRYETVFQFYNDQLAGPRAASLLDAGTSSGGGGGGDGSSGGSGSGSGSGGSSGGGSGSGGGSSSGGGGSGTGGGGSTGAAVGDYHLINFSVRARPSDDGKLIAGFVLRATDAEHVVLRAVGPGLATYDVANPMTAPLLELYDANQQVLATSTTWNGDASLAQAFADVGAFALDPASADAAQAPMLLPGSYTTHVSPSDGSNGIALSEVYFDGTGGLANLSARGPAGDGDAVLIVGFVVGGDQPRRFLIRGVGPGLVPYGVTDALVDPSTRVYDGAGDLVAANDDWEAQTVGTAGDITAAQDTSGAFALGEASKDAALVLTLAPGVYTAHVVGTAPGTGLVEVYELP